MEWYKDFFSFRAFKKTYSKPYLKIMLCYPCCHRSIVYCLSPISWLIVGLISLGFQERLRSLGKGIPKNQPGIELKQQLYPHVICMIKILHNDIKTVQDNNKV